MDSEARRCSNVLFAAANSLRKTGTATGLDAVLKALQGNLDGSSAELDDAVAAASKLCKSIMFIISQNDWADSSTLMCSIVFEIAHLYSRYLGDPTTTDVNERRERFQQRIHLVQQSFGSMVKSVACLAKLKNVHKAFNWETIDKALQGCATLCRSVELARERDGGSPKDAAVSSAFMEISNAYWAYYLLLKQDGTSNEILQGALRRSIQVAAERPSSEKAQCFLASKLEQLAISFELGGDLQQAADNYAQAALTHVDCGLIESSVGKLATLSFAELLANEGFPQSFLRSLKSHVRVVALLPEPAPGQQAFIDRSQLDSAQRGFLLEVQLQALADIVTSPKTLAQAHGKIRNISAILMSIYSVDEFPLRRLRVLAEMLRLELSSPCTFESGFIGSMRGASVNALNRDHGLRHLSAHYQWRVRLLLALLDGLPDPTALSFLDDWRGSLDHSNATKGSPLPGIDGFQNCIKELEMLSNYLQMKGCHDEHIRALMLTTRLAELHQDVDPVGYVAKAMDLGLSLSRMESTDVAGKIMEEAGQTFAKHAMSNEVSLLWHIASVEYYTETANMKKGQEALEKATALLRKVSGNRLPKSQLYWIISEYLQALALNSLTFGSSTQALYVQRRCVSLTYVLWDRKIKESRKHREDLLANSANSDESRPKLSRCEGSTEGAQNATFGHETSRYSGLWSLAPRLFARLLQLGKLLGHEGIFLEAQYYINEAIKIAEAVHSDRLVTTAKIMRADFDTLSGKVDDGFTQLRELKSTIDSIASPQLSVFHAMSLARAHVLRREDVEEFKILEQAQSWVSQRKIHVVPKRGQEDNASDLACRLQDLSLSDKKGSKTKTVAKAQAERSRRGEKNLGQSKASRPPLQQIENESATRPSCVSARISRLQAANLTRRDRVEEAAKLLEAMSECAMLPVDSFSQALGTAENLIRQTTLSYSKSPVFSLLKESTTSYPSISRLSGSGSGPANNALPAQNIRPPLAKAKAENTKTKAKLQSTKLKPTVKERSEAPATRDMLSQCFKTLSSIHHGSQKAASVAFVHKIADLLCKDAMMLTVASSDNSQPRMSATFVAYAMEMGRCLATTRESLSITSEAVLSSENDLSALVDHESMLAELSIPNVDPAKFQADYVNIMPDTWMAISVSVSDDREELRLSKLRAGLPPFVLSIPLARHSSQDPEDEVFSFDQCMTELSSFIDLANFSTHNSRETSNEVSSREWWQARSALDARLRDLLSNVENLWLGGFRSIFAQEKPLREQLSRFQRSFYNILDKHLPSRRKIGKGPKAKPVSFDPRILELFVGLGHPREIEECGSSLMDLLYFVVDALQFHGERNAYDEIDFDSIVIEVIDALTCYHEAVRANPPALSGKHTILILDKALHSFPWESMPCLAGQAVSRVPSLVSLRTRILQQQQQQRDTPTFPADGLYIDPSNGSYILNPEGDLARTEATFQPSLSALPNTWSATVCRAPTESEITTALSTKSLYMYFGHGSGAHYVRARRIRRLDRCAVALLMGCSSGAVTAAGQFESYGTPLHYLFGGAPAVVGNLWDVTDKDIDRFAVRCLQRWGLFMEEGDAEAVGDEGRSPLKGKRSRGRRKGKVNGGAAEQLESNPSGGAVGLDQAVAEAREACILRYLNGAAPVVYGIPVYLWPRK